MHPRDARARLAGKRRGVGKKARGKSSLGSAATHRGGAKRGKRAEGTSEEGHVRRDKSGCRRNERARRKIGKRGTRQESRKPLRELPPAALWLRPRAAVRPSRLACARVHAHKYHRHALAETRRERRGGSRERTRAHACNKTQNGGAECMQNTAARGERLGVYYARTHAQMDQNRG